MSYNTTVQKHNLFQGEKNRHGSNIFTLTINPIHTFNSAKHTTILSLKMFQCVNRLKCCMVRYYRHMLNSHSHCMSNLHEKRNSHSFGTTKKIHIIWLKGRLFILRTECHSHSWLFERIIALLIYSQASLQFILQIYESCEDNVDKEKKL